MPSDPLLKISASTAASASAVAGLSLIGAGLLVWGSQPGGSTGHALAAVLGASALGTVALAVVALDRRLDHLPLAFVLLLALALRLVAISAWPLLEDDHYRYLWDGLRTATLLDPYSLPPSAFFKDTRLPPDWQDVLSGINNPDIPTLYGPVLQGLFAVAYTLAPGHLGALQGLLLLVDMAVLALLLQQGLPRRWLLAYTVHPLVLKEAMASAHPDGVLALLLLLALLFWQRRNAWGLGAMLGLAVATKVAALVVLPLLLLSPRAPPGVVTSALDQRPWLLKAALAMTATLALAYLPFWLAGGSDAQGLLVFGQQWRFNPLAWRVLETFIPGSTARWTAVAVVAMGVGALAWRWRANRQAAQRAKPPPLDAALVVLLLLSPVVNAWYWLWALAPSLALGRTWLAVVALVAPLAYLNSSVLQEAGLISLGTGDAPFTVPWPLAILQVGALALGLWVDAARARASKQAGA